MQTSYCVKRTIKTNKYALHQYSPGDVYTGKAGPAPERTLVKFISTSAAFHGVKKQPLHSLESDLLEVGARPRQPSSSMCICEVEEVRRDSAVLSVREDTPELVWVPGWRRMLAICPGFQLSSQDGDTISLGDIMSYDVGQETKEGFSVVGRNVSVLKESDERPAKAGRRPGPQEDGQEGGPGRLPAAA